MGPSENERLELRIQPVEKLRAAVVSATKKYFEKPAHYLFYGMLTGTVFGLFFNMSFSAIYYGILVILSGFELWDHFHVTK